MSPVGVPHIYSGDDGESHVETLMIPLEEIGTGNHLSGALPGDGVAFWRVDQAHEVDWHPAIASHWIFVMAGSLEVEVGSGAVARFVPGDVFLERDTAGRGHVSRCHGPTQVARIPIPDGFDPAGYRA